MRTGEGEENEKERHDSCLLDKYISAGPVTTAHVRQ